MEYRIVKTDELYHYGVKGMKWGVRHDPERTGNGRQRKSMSTAKKVAIGVGVAVAVGGVSYVAITKRNNRMARASVQRALKQHGKRTVANGGTLWNENKRPMNIRRGPTQKYYEKGPHGLLNPRYRRKRVTGHSGRVTKAGAARHRQQFYSRQAQNAPLSWDYMRNSGGTRRYYEEQANAAGNEILNKFKNQRVVTFDKRGSINRLKRQKGPKVLRSR